MLRTIAEDGCIGRPGGPGVSKRQYMPRRGRANGRAAGACRLAWQRRALRAVRAVCRRRTTAALALAWKGRSSIGLSRHFVLEARFFLSGGSGGRAHCNGVQYVECRMSPRFRFASAHTRALCSRKPSFYRGKNIAKRKPTRVPHGSALNEESCTGWRIYPCGTHAKRPCRQILIILPSDAFSLVRLLSEYSCQASGNSTGCTLRRGRCDVLINPLS